MPNTSRLALPYPLGTQAPDINGDIQALAVAVDSVAARDDQGALADRPAAGTRGRYYYATDIGVVSRDTGTAWVDLNPRASHPLVTSLPSSPFDGQIVHYRASISISGAGLPVLNHFSGADQLVWPLQYVASAPSPYRWLPIGVAATGLAEVNPGDEQTSGIDSYIDLATTGPRVTLPLAGDYYVEFGFQAYWSTPGEVGGTPTAMAAPFVQSETVDNATGDPRVAQVALSTRNLVWGAHNRCTLVNVAANSTVRLRYKAALTNIWFRKRWMRVYPIRLG